MSGEPIAPAEIGVGFVPRFREPVVVVPVQDEAVLYEEDTGALHQLDPIATVVCSFFDGERVIEQVVAELVAAFGAERSVIEADVLALARDLGQKGLFADVLGDPALPSDEVDDDGS